MVHGLHETIAITRFFKMNDAASTALASPASPAPETAASRTYRVVSDRREGIEAALAKLNKKLEKKGLPLLAWTWGPATEAIEHVYRDIECGRDIAGRCSGCRKVVRVPLTFSGPAPRYAGWSLLAALDHLPAADDGSPLTFLQSVPSAEEPHPDTVGALASYRSRKGTPCDHCRAKRVRSSTYVVRHEDGRMVQVGSTCLADFLGIHDAEGLALAASVMMLAASACEDGEGLGGYSEGRGHMTLASFLPVVVACVRHSGWLSRSAARERDQGRQATADQAMGYCAGREGDEKMKKDGIDVTEEDCALAASAVEWALALTEAECAASDYLGNVHVVARANLITGRTVGVGASIIVAYEKAVGRARKAAERAAVGPISGHVGTLGERGEWTAVLDFVTGYESNYGYVTVYKFLVAREDGTRAQLVWKSSGDASCAHALGEVPRAPERRDVGTTYRIRGTVKKHDRYKDQDQTILTRCAVTVPGCEPPPPPKKKAPTAAEKRAARAER